LVTQTPDPPTDARPMLAPVSEKFLAHLGAGIPFPATPVRPDEYAQLVTMIIDPDYLNGENILLVGALRMAPR
jgi:hypothetical protein